MDLMGPLFGANKVSMQRVDYRIATPHLFRVTGWQEDDDVPIRAFCFQISLQRCAVDLDVFDGHGRCAWNLRRCRRLHLS